MIFWDKRGEEGQKKGSERVKRRRLAAVTLALILAFTMIVTSSLAFADTSVSPFTGTAYTHSAQAADRIIVNGVDVSTYQNSIDWNAAKADGVDFALIRIGYRGYGAAGNMKPDDYFVQNIEAAKAAGVMVGVYFFSQALNTLEARAEAKYTLELLEGRELDLPVFMDYEFSPAASGRFTSGTITKLQATANVRAFCEYIEANGYEAGLYANLNFLNKTVDGKTLGDEYPIWVAQYYNTCNYDYAYDYWQYSSSGKVNGIAGRADVNFMYLNKESEKTSDYSLYDSDIYLGSSSFSYSAGAVHEPSISVYHNGIYLTEGIDYEVNYLGNAAAGTAYVLVSGKGSYTDSKLLPFEISPSRDLSYITVQKPKDRKYTGSITKPSYITVTDTRTGEKLIEHLDYIYSVKNAVDVGEAELIVDFIGNYRGSKTVKYNIVKATQTITVADARTSTKLSEGAYKLGVSLTDSSAALTYSSSDKTLALVSSSGEVTPTSEGTVNITIKAAATATYGAAEKLISLTVIDDVVEPEAPALPDEPGDSENGASDDENESAAEAAKNARIKAGVEKTKVIMLKAPEVGRKRVKLTWKKSNSGYRVDNYQIWRSTKKSSGYSKIFTSSNATNKYYINTKGLKPNTTYWYKVRGVRRVDGKLVYTAFTKIQVKTAK